MRADDAHRIQTVELTATSVRLTLVDGTTLSEPISRYVRLKDASPEALARWVLVADDCGLAWPELAPPAAGGMVNVHVLLWERRCDEALSRLQAAAWKVAELPRDEQLVVALFRLEADVNNGGFMQFLTNWGDETCQTPMVALREVGAEKMLAIVSRMRGLLDRLEDDPRIVQLMDLYGAMTGEEHAAMAVLDQAFWAYPDDLPRLAVRRFVAATSTGAEVERE